MKRTLITCLVGLGIIAAGAIQTQANHRPSSGLASTAIIASR